MMDRIPCEVQTIKAGDMMRRFYLTDRAQVKARSDFDRGARFIDQSLVDASGIDSQWKAHFTQTFPARFGDLPKVLPSDRQFFDRHWRGGPCEDGTPMTYEKFMAKAYPDFPLPARVDSTMDS